MHWRPVAASPPPVTPWARRAPVSIVGALIWRPRRHQVAQPAPHLQQQSVLGGSLQNPEIPAPVPKALRLHSGCQAFGTLRPNVCRRFFVWYNQDHHHAGPGLMTPDQNSITVNPKVSRPPARAHRTTPSAPILSASSESPRTTRQTHCRLDQSASKDP